jgi:hypothetical protein
MMATADKTSQLEAQNPPGGQLDSSPDKMMARKVEQSSAR